MAGVPRPRGEGVRASSGSIVGSKSDRRTHLPEIPDEPFRIGSLASVKERARSQAQGHGLRRRESGCARGWSGTCLPDEGGSVSEAVVNRAERIICKSLEDVLVGNISVGMYLGLIASKE